MSDFVVLAKQDSPTVLQVFPGGPVSVFPGSVIVGEETWAQLAVNTIAIDKYFYLVHNAGANPLQIILPLNAPLGFSFTALSVDGLFQITQNPAQKIRFGNVETTGGVSGKLVSSENGDCIKLACIQPPTLWAAMLVVGNISFF